MKKGLLIIGIFVGIMFIFIQGVFAISDYWLAEEAQYDVPFDTQGEYGPLYYGIPDCNAACTHYCEFQSCEDKGWPGATGNWIFKFASSGAVSSAGKRCYYGELCWPRNFGVYPGTCNYGTNEAIPCENGCLYNEITDLFVCSECHGPNDYNAVPTCDNGVGGLECAKCPTEPSEKLYTECEYRLDSSVPRDGELDSCGICYGVEQDKIREIPWDGYQCDNDGNGETDDCFQCCNPENMKYIESANLDENLPEISRTFQEIQEDEVNVIQSTGALSKGVLGIRYYDPDSDFGGFLRNLDSTPFFDTDDPIVKEFLDDYISDNLDWPSECGAIRSIYNLYKSRVPSQTLGTCGTMSEMLGDGAGICRQQAAFLSYVFNYYGIESKVVTGSYDGEGHAWVRVFPEGYDGPAEPFDLDPMWYKNYFPLTIRGENGGSGPDLENCFICDQINECYTIDDGGNGVMDSCAE